MRRSRLISAAILASAAVTVMATPAHAQLGKLKKLGADAIKEAAKAKLSGSEPEPTKPAAGSSASPASSTSKPNAPTRKAPNYSVTAERLDLVLASIQPLVAAAEMQAAAKKVEGEYETKKKAAEACLERAGKMANPMAIAMNSDPKRQARVDAMQKQLDGVNKRSESAMQRDDFKAAVALRDTSLALTMTMSAASIGANCSYPYMPLAMIEAQAAMEKGNGASSSSDGDDTPTFDPSPAAKQAMSQQEFGTVRERIALWSMLQANPALAKQMGKEGKFTPDEEAALTAKAAQVKKLADLFQTNALRWSSWGDVKSW